MRIKLALLVVALLLVAAALQKGAPAPPDRPIIRGSWCICTDDVNAPVSYLRSNEFHAALEKRFGKDHWRTVYSTDTFEDDQPEFKSLMADPDRKAAEWVTVGTAKKITSSKPLPATEAEAEKLIGK